MSHPIADGLLTTYALLTVQAIAPIIVGSFKSLKTPAPIVSLRRAARRRQLIRTNRLPDDLSDDEWADTEGRARDEGGDDDDDEAQDEALTWSDTLLFPILGSVVLLGFYAIIRYAGTEWINRILGVYFTGAGMFAIQSTFSTLIRFSLRTIGRTPKIYHLRISSELRQIAHSTLTLPTLLLLPLSMGLPLLYIPLDKPYWLSNIIALSLGTASLGLLKLDSFKTAGLLLGVLLVYDIFWVFATPVMVTVAKSLDAPIKLLAPKPTTSPSSSVEYAMLGLGDVVIPGLMIALCLRFDLAQYAKRRLADRQAGSTGTVNQDIGPKSPFPRPYFWMGIISYLIGLGTTMGVMHVWKAAQPALLYLSPACFLGPILLALVRGELSDLWSYTESRSDSSTGQDKDKPKAGAKVRDGATKVSAVMDDTIEKGSEIAQQAREAARGSLEQAAGEADGKDKQQDKEEEDDSWMDLGSSGNTNGNGNGNGNGGAKRKKGKKK